MKKIFTLSIAVVVTVLSFGQAQRLVLFEEFTGENCPPCAAYNPYVDALAAQSPSEVVLIHYIAPIPSAGILSAQVSAVVNGRMNYYGVNSTPWGQQDGAMWDSTLLANDGNNPITWCTDNSGNVSPVYLNAEYALPAPFTITVTDTLTGVSDSFYATVTITAAEAFATTSLKLQMSMVENLQFAAPPGNNGETNWSNAVRAMYPNYAGTVLPTTWTSGMVKTFTFKGKMPAFIRDKNNVRFVAFIQDATKHIQQTGISNFYTFNLDLSTTGVQGSFGNCVNAEYTPVVNLSNTGTQTISSCHIAEYVDNVFVDSANWTGSITAGNTANAILSPLTIGTGVHKVTVKLTQPNNIADPNPTNDTTSITVNLPTAIVNTPLVEGFENGDPVLVGGWAVDHPDHDSTWRLVSTGHSSTHSYMVDYYDDLFNDFVGPSSTLYAPPVNLTYAAHATVKFDYANQLINFGDGYGGDSLYVDVSTDCGATWTTVYSTGTATAPAQTYGNSLAPFVPTSTQWATDSADISLAANHDHVLIRFKPTSDDGNDFYLDNVNIYKYDSINYVNGILAVSGIQSIAVYPNPANAQISVALQLENEVPVSCQIMDVTGNVVMAVPAEVKNAGQSMFSVNTSQLAEGVYFVTVTAGNDRATKMISLVR